MNKLLYLLCYLLPAFSLANDTAKSKPLVTQRIVYHTKKASKLYLVWDLDNWKTVPDNKYFPKNSFIKDGMAWSPFEGNKDSFAITISLPVRSNLSFMVWVPIDNKGDSTDGWDTYGSQTYTTEFVENKTLRLGDGALWLPEKGFQFNLLQFGSNILISSLILSAITLFLFRKKLRFSKTGLIIGVLLSCVIMHVLVRLQMNDLFNKNQSNVFGAIFNDLSWLLCSSTLFLLLMFLFRKYRRINTIILVFFVVLQLFSVLFSLLNIEVVKILGRPVNYQWLYYSDFMTGNDARQAVAANLSKNLVLNVAMILVSVVVFSSAWAFIPKRAIANIQKPLALFALLIFSFSYYQSKAIRYEKGKIENPITELISSSIISQGSSKLFSMQVPDKTKKFIEDYHSQNYQAKFDSLGIIKNIVLFVLESTPKQFVDVYDSTYNATPNIKKWRRFSSMYTNMYAHLPATVYSLGSINSGVYPLISYESFVAMYPNNSVSTLSGELNKNGWNTSLLFAADLAYSNMGMYAKSHGFSTAEDNTTINCSFKKFGNSNTFLDQLDDRCLSTRYLNWLDTARGDKKFSLLWTTQTHYSYLAREERKYTSKNADLNRYLNALRDSDEAFGILMDGLEKRGVLKNTLVIVTADHGEAFGTHNQTIHATKIYEENVSIPFIMYNPVLFKGETNNQICGLIDIPPTLTHVLGFRKPVEWEGKSVLTENEGDRTFFICPFNDLLFGTREKKWKFIYNAATDEKELYDLDTDPGELKNIASTQPGIAKKQFEMIAGWAQYHNKMIKPFLK